MKIIQDTLKNREKNLKVSKKFRVSPKKVRSLGFPETRHFFGLIIYIHVFYCDKICGDTHFSTYMYNVV